MLRTIATRFLLFGLWFSLNSYPIFAQTFTPEDRARMIRTETKLEELEKRMLERFDQVDKRFEDNLSYIGYMIGLFGSMFALTLVFALWDRRTMVRPFETKVNEIDAELLKLKNNKNTQLKIVSVLRDLSKTDPKLADILKSHKLL
jgi:hypothetical protein